MPRKFKRLGDYEVGFGKPPQHTRFKPGESGNPKGRSKGARNLKTVLEEAFKREFLQTVTVTEGGRTIKISKIELMAKSNVNKAAGGDPRAIRELVALANRVGLFEPATAAAVITKPERLSPDDQAIVDRFFDRERARMIPQVLNEECTA